MVGIETATKQLHGATEKRHIRSKLWEKKTIRANLEHSLFEESMLKFASGDGGG